MKIILKPLTQIGKKGLEKLERQSKAMLLKRLIIVTWNSDKTELIITNQNGVQMQSGRKAKREMIQRLDLYLTSICKLSKEDYEVC